MIGFKREYHKRLYREYLQIDQRLRWILDGLDLFFIDEFGFSPVITCLFRTPEENEAVGGIKYSAHLDGRAVDIRTEYLSDSEIIFVVDKITGIWAELLYVVHHKGHIHINIKYER